MMTYEEHVEKALALITGVKAGRERDEVPAQVHALLAVAAAITETSSPPPIDKKK
jgi:hypothetical protein